MKDIFNADKQFKHREVWNNKWVVDHLIGWGKQTDISAKEKILEDVSNGYQGGFDTPVSDMLKDEFLKKYDLLIESFIETWNDTFHNPEFSHRPGETQPAIGNPVKSLAWVREYNKGDECLLHNHTTHLGQIAFSAVHLVKQEEGHPNIWFQYGPERVDIVDFKEDDVIIFPSIIPHAVDKNLIDSKRITFIFDFTVETL